MHSELNHKSAQSGALILNADDFGRNAVTTNRILDCARLRSISSASAMVFMEDSARAADLAQESKVDVGLHLNLAEAFSGQGVTPVLAAHQERVCRFLMRNRFARVVYHPGLVNSFEYVVAAQLEEYRRLYGKQPGRIDGHHHMHLCSNVLLGNLLPAGTIVRRNFSMRKTEAGWANLTYRRIVDRILERKHRITDFFFSMIPLEPADRLDRVFDLASRFVVEIETHPFIPAEYRFLTGGELFERIGSLSIESCYSIPTEDRPREKGKGDSMDVSYVVGNSPHHHESISVLPHISVCICTYKRPELLKRLLNELNSQETNGEFSYSIVVADNDRLCSGEAVVNGFRSPSVPIKYCAEPRQSIALARNKAVANAAGDFIALIDDDEIPERTWLRKLFENCTEFNVDGVLGPVTSYFDEAPPQWIIDSQLFNRPVIATGTPVRWQDARTGNVLFKRAILNSDEEPFRRQFRMGEDQDFFRRMTEAGGVFIWSDEAVVHEIVPPARWRRSYLLRKALLRGATARLQPSCDAWSVAKSLVAVPLYTAALPVMFLVGHHRFMALLVRLCDHLGKLLALVGINPVKDEYISE